AEPAPDIVPEPPGPEIAPEPDTPREDPIEPPQPSE
ncbi:MAG: hypothetical protein QOF26_2847, partial [Baekduia sp.]|nr:hypothetical protein [Baekduia sp.]